MHQPSGSIGAPPPWPMAIILLIATSMIAALEWWIARSDLVLAILALNAWLAVVIARMKPADHDPRWARKIDEDPIR